MKMYELGWLEFEIAYNVFKVEHVLHYKYPLYKFNIYHKTTFGK